MPMLLEEELSGCVARIGCFPCPLEVGIFERAPLDDDRSYSDFPPALLGARSLVIGLTTSGEVGLRPYRA
jgi:hypothetical protein